MPTVDIAGIATRYEVVGSGPPILMYAPGGFDATIEKWRTLNIYARVKLLDHLPSAYTCVLFDRRECGQSGGRVEPITWAHFVEQGKGLLDHLGFPKAHILGGCMGVSCAIAFAAKYPDRVSSLVLWWPGGRREVPHQGQQRFFDHLAFVEEAGTPGRGGPRGRARARRSMPSPVAVPGRRSSSATRSSPAPMRARTSSNTRRSLPTWRSLSSTATPRPAPSPRR
jgi:pimeloyl-ACP methyl ester carboxylesterase